MIAIIKNNKLILNSSSWKATKGITRGKYGSKEESITPEVIVSTSKGNADWTKVSDLINPPRDLQERYLKVYLEAIK